MDIFHNTILEMKSPRRSVIMHLSITETNINNQKQKNVEVMLKSVSLYVFYQNAMIFLRFFRKCPFIFILYDILNPHISPGEVSTNMKLVIVVWLLM